MDNFFFAMGYGGGYPVAGLTHGVPIQWHVKLLERYKEKLRNFILIRNPIQRIQSATRQISSGFPIQGENILMDEGSRKIFEGLSNKSGRVFSKDPTSLGFYNSCSLVNSIIQETDFEIPIYKLEDLVTQTDEVQRLVSHISDGAFRIEDRTILKLQRTVINRHAEKALSPQEILILGTKNIGRHFIIL